MLFTKAILKKLAQAGDGYKADKAICKIFNPYGAGTWVIFGQDPTDPDILYGACDLGMQCVEFGGVRRSELEEVYPLPGCGLERDLYFRHVGKPVSFFIERDNLAGV